MTSSKRRLASLATGSALIATMAVASLPGATLAAESGPTGFIDRDGTVLTAKIINPTSPVTGTIKADGYDIAVYFDAAHPGSVANADISGAKYYGIVADGAKVNVTGSKVHHIGDDPYGIDGTAFSGAQHGRAIVFINGASGKISGNQVYDFQKSGIEVNGLTADGGSVFAIPTTSATVEKNVVTGEGQIDYIAQNGIVIRSGATATVKNNTVSKVYYTGADDACGLLLYQAGPVAASANKFANNEVNIEGANGNPGGHVKP
jgi:hypothetical protein